MWFNFVFYSCQAPNWQESLHRPQEQHNFSQEVFFFFFQMAKLTGHLVWNFTSKKSLPHSGGLFWGKRISPQRAPRASLCSSRRCSLLEFSVLSVEKDSGWMFQGLPHRVLLGRGAVGKGTPWSEYLPSVWNSHWGWGREISPWVRDFQIRVLPTVS